MAITNINQIGIANVKLSSDKNSLYIPAAGKLGVGTESPLGVVHVSDTTDPLAYNVGPDTADSGAWARENALYIKKDAGKLSDNSELKVLNEAGYRFVGHITIIIYYQYPNNEKLSYGHFIFGAEWGGEAFVSVVTALTDTNVIFSVTKDNAGTINVFLSSSGNALSIQNKQGADYSLFYEIAYVRLSGELA